MTLKEFTDVTLNELDSSRIWTSRSLEFCVE